jgi:hypothetical protein
LLCGYSGSGQHAPRGYANDVFYSAGAPAMILKVHKAVAGS